MSAALRVVCVLTVLTGLCAGCDRAGPIEEARPDPSAEGLSDVTTASGIAFRHDAGATGSYFLPEIMGPGVAVLDYDGDGDLDIYAPQGSPLDGRVTARPGTSANRLFANRLRESGRLAFEEVPGAAGAADAGYGMGVATGDVDNDGDTDLYVTNFGPNGFYRNDGHGRFEDVTADSGADDPRWNTSAAFLDYDRDGDLDLFVAAYVDFSTTGNRICGGSYAEQDYCSPVVYPPVADRLFRNDGDWHFVDVTREAGIASVYGAGLGVTVLDFDNDGWLDIYVANDRSANQLWRNLGDGRFEDVGLRLGAAYNAEGMAEASMGVTAGDFDSDGDDDLFMTHYDPETNTLYRNDGVGGFLDVTARAGLAAPSLNLTGWGTAWLDVDNDGRLDLFVANGGIRRLPTRIPISQRPYEQRDQLFLARPDGSFSEVGPGRIPALAEFHNSRGAAFGDIDEDGRVDVVEANNNGPLRLLRNTARDSGHWLIVRAAGVSTPRDGHGAHIAAIRHGRPPLWRRAGTGGSYLSASDPGARFGLGRQGDPVRVEILWTDGKREGWDDVEVDRIVVLEQGTGQAMD